MYSKNSKHLYQGTAKPCHQKSTKYETQISSKWCSLMQHVRLDIFDVV